MRFGPKVRWDVTLVCNLACRHCQVGDARRAGVVHPSRELVMSVSTKLIEGGVSHIGLLGGEPLLHPYILDLLRVFAEHGIPVTISTNGFRLPVGLVPIMAESSGWSIMISLDGPDDETHEKIRGRGTFKRTIRNIEHLVSAAKRNQIVVGIACTLTSFTVWRMKEIYDLANHLGVDLIQFGVVKAVGNAKINYEELQVKPEALIAGLAQFMSQTPYCRESEAPQVIFDFINRPIADVFPNQTNGWNLHTPSTECIGADSTAFVDSTGCLWPCPPVHDGFQNGSLNYSGSLDNSLVVNNFETIWYGDLFQRFRQLKNKKTHITNGIPCKNCIHADTCKPCPLPYWNGSYGHYDLCEYALNHERYEVEVRRAR